MANLQSLLHESRVFTPSESFCADANVANQAAWSALTQRAKDDPEAFWADEARQHLHWHTPFTTVLQTQRAPHYTWFGGGELNVSYNCIDVHLPHRADKAAIVYEAEDGHSRTLTYQDLHDEVCRLAQALRKLGLRCGDRAVILLPNIPEAIVAMQACARLGVIHSVVFGGFSAVSLKDRIEDSEASLLITADGAWRGGKRVELKQVADAALAQGCASIKNVVMLRHTGFDVPMQPGRDLVWGALVAQSPSTCEPVWVPSAHPLFLLYTSGSTGKPKGIVHGSAGYLLGAITSMRWALDARAHDVFWCTADVGWVTGHTYVAYGPLALGATLVIYDGIPTHPHGGRFWQIIERHAVSLFYTAPTAIRALMRLGDALPAQYNLRSLRLLASVGEPINPEAWMWFYTVVGGSRCPLVDTWWQTETGCIMIAPVPGVVAAKPGSCTLPLPGVDADIVDDAGNSLRTAGQGGALVVRRPWPAMLQTVWRDDARYVATYWQKFAGRFYVAGDGAHRDADGYFWILGRVDDVLNVSGHRLGTMEIEAALAAHPQVAEAAVVGVPHALKGEAVFAYVVLRAPKESNEALRLQLRHWVGEQIGAIAKPDTVRLCAALPKTRSGKVMRRLLRAIARGDAIGDDLSTLENPEIVAQLRASL